MPTREERRLQNSKQNKIAFLNYKPASLSLEEGETVEALVNGKLREYKKRMGKVYYKEYSLDGNENVEKDLTVGDDLDIGRVLTVPKQPAFLAYNSTTDTNIATNSWVTIDFDTEVYDNTNNFASDVFTAPRTGKYILSANVVLEALDSAATKYRARINTSNRFYLSQIDPNFSADLDVYTFSITAIADMDKDDTAKIEVYQTSGTQQTDVLGGSWLQTYFCGWFLG